jgi:hypothetical protein
MKVKEKMKEGGKNKKARWVESTGLKSVVKLACATHSARMAVEE